LPPTDQRPSFQPGGADYRHAIRRAATTPGTPLLHTEEPPVFLNHLYVLLMCCNHQGMFFDETKPKRKSSYK
jgi:hypothetical protein